MEILITNCKWLLLLLIKLNCALYNIFCLKQKRSYQSSKYIAFCTNVEPFIHQLNSQHICLFLKMIVSFSNKIWWFLAYCCISDYVDIWMENKWSKKMIMFQENVHNLKVHLKDIQKYLFYSFVCQSWSGCI